MVFFICDGCGDTLKKNQVDSHVNRCRQCYSVSCMDCFVQFFGGKSGRTSSRLMQFYCVTKGQGHKCRMMKTFSIVLEEKRMLSMWVI